MTADLPISRRRYQPTDPRRRALGWMAVIVLHIVIAWALITGTAQKGLHLLKKPMEAAVIQEVIIPPPPPPPPPPPKKIEKVEPKHEVVKAPPPPFVPPPEVTPPVTSAPSIQSVQTPPPVMAPIAPPPPPAPPAPKPTGPVRKDIGVACPTQVKPDMPKQALRDGAEGVVRAQVTIRDGAVKEVTILSGPRVFHAAVRAAMMQYQCENLPGEVTAVQEFSFKLDQ
jgi:periplasmic protein TonB